MRTQTLRNLTALMGSLFALLLSSCETVRSGKHAGCLVIPYRLTPTRADAGFGEIRVTYDTKWDQEHPTRWQLSGFNNASASGKVSPYGSVRPCRVRAMTYVIEFSTHAGDRPPPETRTVQIPEKQRLTLRVTYKRKAGQKDCR